MKMLFLKLILLSISLLYLDFSHAKNLSTRELAHYEREASIDNKIAFELAHVYLQGSQGVTKDQVKAVKWFQKIAEGYSNDYLKEKSAYVLGSLYMGAQDHPVDHTQARRYFSIASKNIKETALIDAPYHFSMLTQDNKLHIEYLEMSARADYLPAILQLVSIYLDKKRVAPNDNALVKWLKLAADKEHVEAQALIGSMYFDGDKVYQDYERAYYYLVRAAEQKHTEAQAKLGLIHKLGLGKKVDLKNARMWFERAYASGNDIAGENLANILLYSKVEGERNKGLEILAVVAESGSKSAAQQMIVIYQDGKLVTKNAEKLNHWQTVFNNSEESASTLIGLNKATKGGDSKVYQAPSKAASYYAEG